MPVEIDIAKVARLARLSLTDEQLERYRVQCEVVLEHAARVQALPTEGVAPTSHPLPRTNVFREDEVAECLDREEVLAAAPDRDGDYFLVPRILDE
ncbi:MAG: Asp-tRNA(Asn)/Glu-tRNA(Gln) amidotransferase subunit GatC [Acidimicrobiia bacterium]|nr:Asp-tRNA(Asn)/Glu-tRNA(Gln) amidotransferase subunit GatC [Acidimicrobiia bacterium]MBT8215992.1 Asp-tRNA(Asn)/Glu-tRNA(Gln) amidotransferase subunit GatC [Acidimicrobiia bacterium]NNF10765.1 Asp-tRNA(Asn)/Glu-tRNA(Gln) amidotransferase subunit GatC [Acidimicrobiia bacterium]NNL69206.1 Asp-tRNA(Asn)/Glu-tRNA(Gln) amidotransferase subunit GatC [Acidimicrobiia bacterium]